MDSLRDIHPEAENSDATATEIPDTFRRRLMSSRRYLCPRRYVIALMLFLLLLIKEWRNTNVGFMVLSLYLAQENPDLDPSIGNWTTSFLLSFDEVESLVYLLAQIPAAVLIYFFASHKCLLISTVATSILHILTPTALEHHSISLIVVLIGQALIEAPTFAAVISMWKDWAPPLERSKLVIFSVSGMFIGYASLPLYLHTFDFLTSYESYYCSGAAGLIWALLWCTITRDTPQNDPLISENELLYLEASIPSDIQQKGSLKDIPWKSILTTKPIIILCIIFFKMSLSADAIRVGSVLVTEEVESHNPVYLLIPFMCAFVIVITSGAISADYLIKKFSGRTLLIRKCFLCVGFFLQSIFLLGTFSASKHVKAVFFVMAYVMYAASLPGFLTLALDLSPRYVAILVGLLQTSYYIASIGTHALYQNTPIMSHLDSMPWFFFIDGIISLICAALFAKWADVEEQSWSTNFSTSQNSDGYRSYPNPEHHDESNLVEENNFSRL